MAFIKFLTRMVFATVLLLDLAVRADGCRCFPLTMCEGFEAADVVLRGTALSREEPETGNTVTYVLDTKTLFKAEPNVRYAKEISFVTNESSAACGVTLEIGKQYLIGLGRNDDGQLSASSCGLVRRWNAVTKEERASIRAGCEDDPCDGSCGEFQECLFHSDNLGDEYYCADVCDPSPCEDGEECTLEQLVQCFRAPCPPSAVCSGSKN